MCWVRVVLTDDYKWQHQGGNHHFWRQPSWDLKLSATGGEARSQISNTEICGDQSSPLPCDRRSYTPCLFPALDAWRIFHDVCPYIGGDTCLEWQAEGYACVEVFVSGISHHVVSPGVHQRRAATWQFLEGNGNVAGSRSRYTISSPSTPPFPHLPLQYFCNFPSSFFFFLFVFRFLLFFIPFFTFWFVAVCLYFSWLIILFLFIFSLFSFFSFFSCKGIKIF